MTPLERILQALREHGIEAKKSGQGWSSLCPAHRDRNPSLSIREESPGGRIFVKCFTNCPDTSVLKVLGLEVRDLFPESPDAPKEGEPKGLDVETLAAAKKLPVEFLNSLGVETTWLRKTHGDPAKTVIEARVDPGTWNSLEFKSQWREVLIPYRRADGTEARPRRRMKVSGNPKHCWAGTKEEYGEIIPYGLDRLEKARTAGYLILVEGETDCWSLWLHDFPALGVPGASITKTLRREQFDGINRVYLVQEPDAGGETFFDAVREKLSSWKSWKGELFVLRKPGGAKDVSDLRARDPDSFAETMNKVLADAESVPLSRDEGKPNKPDPEKMQAALAASEIRPLTDMGNAERLITRHGQDLRYCYEMDKWFVWNGKHWEGTYAAVERKAKEAVRAIVEEVDLVDSMPSLSADEREALKVQIRSHALYSESRPRINAMIELAKSEGGVQIHAADLDADHWLFNVQNGTVDLRTGVLRPHDCADLITHVSCITYDKDAQAHLWESFIADIMAGDPEMAGYLQRVVGYCLTGEVSEQCLFFLWGAGSNGKSTFTEAVQALLGNLCHKSVASLFTRSKYGGDDGRATPELARLRGKRLVVTCELDIGKRVDEAQVKDLTGNDTIVARGLYQDYIEFAPTHKLFVFGNHKPMVKGADHGIWRRLRLIPFTVCFDDYPEKKDTKLKDKLMQELPGILNWAIAGCQAWQQSGLGVPRRVQEATETYRRDMDVLGQFLSECCVIGKEAQVSSADLYREYTSWAYINHEPEPSRKAFGMMLQERGFHPSRSSSVRSWQGIGLQPTLSEYEDEDLGEADNPSSRPESPIDSANDDAFMTHGDASKLARVTPQDTTSKQLTSPGDACDAFRGKTSDKSARAISCTRDREENSLYEKSCVETRHRVTRVTQTDSERSGNVLPFPTQPAIPGSTLRSDADSSARLPDEDSATVDPSPNKANESTYERWEVE